jgi:hypothetical protein
MCNGLVLANRQLEVDHELEPSYSDAHLAG